MGLIYCLTNKINGKQYIGQTIDINRRMRDHRNTNKNFNCVISKAIHKYGWDNFTCWASPAPDDRELRGELEIRYITELNTFKNGYNMTPGGEGYSGKNHPMYGMKGKLSPRYGMKHSKETKRKISEAHTGKKRKFSEEHKENLSKALKEKYIGKNNSRAKPIILIHPDGIEEKFDCMADADRKYNLSSGNLSRVLNGIYKQYKGFKIRHEN